MKQDLTHIVFLLDRSGSMESVKDDTIGGFNEFLKKQKEASGEATVTLAQFDNLYETVYSAKPVKEAPELTPNTYQPRAMTALVDSFCRLIDETGEYLKAIPEPKRPALVVFVVLTDGLENASSKFTNDDLSKRITEQRDIYKWQFVFLGANQDAFAQARKMGFDQDKVMAYGKSPIGTRAAYAAVAHNLVGTRRAVEYGAPVMVASAGLNFSNDQMDMQDEEIAKVGGVSNKLSKPTDDTKATTTTSGTSAGK